MKKVLSFVLVLAMVLGCTSMAFATTFKDQAEVTNTEAVAVLNAVGVLEGDDNGNMRPTATLTRAEACAMVARLMLGTTAAKKLTATVAPFADVAADNWAAGYIAYCASEGIVAGVGNNNFNPTGTLKVGEFGKMLLCVLGYNAETEKLTGSDWANNTAKLMVAAGITVAQSNNDDCAREVAAQVALNALKATCVEYTTAGTSVTVGNTTINVGGSKASAVAAKKANGGFYDYTVVTDGIKAAEALTDTDTLELAEKLYPGKLVFGGTKKDGFGRTAKLWKYDGKEIGKFSSNVLVMSATKGIKAADLYSKLGANASLSGIQVNQITAAHVTEGAFYCGTVSYSGIEAVASLKDNAKTIGGNGIITEIYKTATADLYEVVQIVPVLAQVTSVTKTVATSLKGACTTYTLKTTDAKEIFLKEFTTVVNEEDDVNTFVADCTLAKDDYVMVYGPEDHYVVKAATKVTGLLTGKTSLATVTVDGTKYDANAFGTMKSANPNAKTKQVILLDAYGYAVKSLAVNDEFIYVFDVADKYFLDSATSIVDGAKVIYATLTDGTFVEAKATYAGLLSEGLYKYSVDSKGVYNLTNAGIDTVAVTTLAATSLIADGVYANNSTKYLVAQYDKAAKKYTGIVVYTGYANMPKSANVSPYAFAMTDTAVTNSAKYVFVDSPVLNAMNANYVYLTGSYSVEGTKSIYDVVVKGENTQMVLDSGIKNDTGLVNIDVDGKVKPFTNANVAVAAGTDGIYTDGAVSYADGIILISGAGLGADYTYQCDIVATVPVYSFEWNVCTVMTAADLYKVSFSRLVLDVNTAKTAVEAIYLVK